MNRRAPLTFVCVLACAIALTACGRQLQKAEEIEPATDEHGEALYKGYLDQSRLEYAEGDYQDSDFFADRAVLAGGNEKFDPQPIEARDLPADMLNEMAAARGEYITAVYRGSVQKLPVTSAEAQVRFDCWMQEQEENFQPEDIAACREAFEQAMYKINASLTDTGFAVSDDRLVFDVFFDFDSDALSATAKEHLAGIAAVARTYENPVVTVLGNADQVGATDYNLDLSGRRANAVAKQLEANGVRPNAVISRGDQAPAVDNPQRQPEAMNRRALIVIREATAN